MNTPLLKRLKSFIGKERQRIFIVGIIIQWAVVIFIKQGGQSLLIHYLWPSVVFGAIIVLFKKSWFKNKFGYLHIVALLALGVFFFTFLFDLTPSDGSLELMNISGGILLAIVLSQEKWDNKSLSFLFVLMVMIISIVDVWGLITYALGHPFNRLVGPLIKPNEAFAGYPNLAANLNLLVILPAFYLFIESLRKKGIHKVSFFIVNILILISLVLTYSRAAWISAAIVMVISAFAVLATHKKEKKKERIFIFSVLSIVLLSFIFVAALNGIRGLNEKTVSVQEKLTFQSQDEGSSIEERIASFKRGLDMIISHPLEGVGAGSFNYISQSFEQNFSTLSSYPYSLPFKIASEHGIITFALLVIWLVLIIFSGFRSKNVYGRIATLTVCMLLIHHCIDNNLNFFAASLPFFILTGMIWEPAKSAKNKTIVKNYWLLIIVIVVTLLGFLFTLNEGWYGRYYIQGRNAAGAGEHEEAFNKYQESERLSFPRDARLASALSAFEMYKNSDQEKWLEQAQNKTLTYHQTDNPLDRRGTLLLAQINFEQKNYTECLGWVYESRIIGGENYFETDYLELMCLIGKGETEKIETFAEDIKPKLEKYLELLKVNAHMTVLTDNPKFAIKILEELRKTRYDEFEDLYEEMYTTAQLELEKFHTKYGIEAEVEL